MEVINNTSLLCISCIFITPHPTTLSMSLLHNMVGVPCSPPFLACSQDNSDFTCISGHRNVRISHLRSIYSMGLQLIALFA